MQYVKTAPRGRDRKATSAHAIARRCPVCRTRTDDAPHGHGPRTGGTGRVGPRASLPTPRQRLPPLFAVLDEAVEVGTFRAQPREQGGLSDPLPHRIPRDLPSEIFEGEHARVHVVGPQQADALAEDPPAVVGLCEARVVEVLAHLRDEVPLVLQVPLPLRRVDPEFVQVLTDAEAEQVHGGFLCHQPLQGLRDFGGRIQLGLPEQGFETGLSCVAAGAVVVVPSSADDVYTPPGFLIRTAG
mmetsp:Transcript_26862/g.53650  ORF Transcript_26862/g.53650 Transcript_26862/m.53650 type:complete len:242 (+) Transcript_26862:133-858(+)